MQEIFSCVLGMPPAFTGSVGYRIPTRSLALNHVFCYGVPSPLQGVKDLVSQNVALGGACLPPSHPSGLLLFKHVGSGASQRQTLRLGGVYNMHNVSKIVASVGIIALLSSLALSAKTVEQAYVDSYQGSHSEGPVPLSVVAPTATSDEAGQVELTFVVNAQGLPTEIAVKTATNENLVASAKAAVAQWKFVPAKLNGEPVACKVMLPVRVVLPE